MQKRVLLSVIIGAILAASIVPGYGLAQRAAIASLEFDFERLDLTNVDFSETNSFGSMQRIVSNAESPSLSMLDDFRGIQASIASPSAFVLDMLSNTQLEYSMFMRVHNPSYVEAVIDRAEVQVLINGRLVSAPVTIQQQQRIPAGGSETIEIQGISVNGKDIAGILLNVASDDFVLTFDLAIGTYFPTIFGDVQVPVNANLQMYLVPPKPSLVGFEDPVMAGVQTVSATGGDLGYELSIANQNAIPLTGKLEVGVMKGNFFDLIGLCDPACIAPVDHGFATFLRIKGSSVFGIQLYDFDNIGLEPGGRRTVTLTNPDLRNNAKSAFIVRWAPDYSKIPYVMTTDVQGKRTSVTGEYESTSFSNVRKIAYNVVRDFGYVGSEEFVSPDKSTLLTLAPSSTSAYYGKTVTFSGTLKDSYGNAIANAPITIKENDLIGDDFMASGKTDSAGKYNIAWTVSSNDPNSTADVYAVFEGNTSYERSVSKEIGVMTSLESTTLTIQASSYSVNYGDTVILTGRLSDSNGNGIANAPILIKDEDTFSGDDLMAMGTTDSTGRFEIEWKASKNDFDPIADVFAVFEGNLIHGRSVSKEIRIQTSITSTSLSLSMSSSSVSIGDRVTFTGYLTDETGNGISEKRIFINDADVDFDDTLGSATTESDGSFSLIWIAEDREGLLAGNSLEVYAVFEGDSLYQSVRTIQYDLAMD